MKRNDILFLLASTALLVFAWIGFSVYHNVASSTIPQNVSEQIEPINPSFDVSTIGKLKQRKKTVPVLQIKAKASPTPVPSISVQPTRRQPLASESALTPTAPPTPTATQGGSLTP